MTPTCGYHSLIQYCPDASRLEACNMGVLLFRLEPRVLLWRMSFCTVRIRRFFGRDGDLDADYLLGLQWNIDDSLDREVPGILTLADLEAFIGQLANEIRITTPRPMVIESPEETLETLFRELVLP